MGSRGNSQGTSRVGDDAYAQVAARVRAQGVRVDTRLAILQLLGSQDPGELGEELDAMLEEVEDCARRYARELRGG